MRIHQPFSRRSLLATAGAATLALPWLEALSGQRIAKAQAATPIKRFLVFFWPGGVIKDQFWPTGGDTGFELPYILKPMEAFRDRLLLLDGLDLKPMPDGVGQEHAKGMGALLTGRALGPGEFAFFNGGSADFAQGPSVDHVIGQHIGAQNKFKTLEYGVLWPTYGSGPTPQNIINYSAAGQPAQPMRDPYQAFMRVFAGVGGTASEADAFALRNKKTQLVLDAAAKEFEAVSAVVGMEDRARLQEHLARLQEVGASLGAGSGSGESCKVPTGITSADQINYETGGDGSHQTIETSTSNRMPIIGKQMMDMAVMSLACDLTRVATVQWTDAASRASFPWLNLHENHHFYQHDGGFQQQPCADICKFFMEQLAYLCTQLSLVKEGDKTLLDSTTILVASEISDPPSHDYRRAPFMLVGDAGGAFKTGGRHLKYDALPHNNLLVSLMNAYGVPGETFGEERYCTGPLTGLI